MHICQVWYPETGVQGGLQQHLTAIAVDVLLDVEV